MHNGNVHQHISVFWGLACGACDLIPFQNPFHASVITNIASLTESTTTVGYPDRPIRCVFSFICPVNRRLRFLGPLRIILLRLAINEHTNLTAICTIVHQRNTMHCFSVSMRYTYTTKRHLVAYILQSKRLVHWRPRPWPATNLPNLMYHSLSHQ